MADRKQHFCDVINFHQVVTVASASFQSSLFYYAWLQVIKEIQIFLHKTICGQTLGVFKGENNECIRNGGKTNLHKMKIVFFDFPYVVL